jgi:condensin complex subunit 2
MRGRRVKINEDGDGEVDVNFWAQAAADQANGRREDDDGDEGLYHISFLHMLAKVHTFKLDGSGNIPFNTQFFQDDYDDGGGFGPGFDDDGDGPRQGVDEDEALLTLSPKKRLRPETFNYAKKAKRVDVRKLKDNIWKGLDIAVPHKKDTAGEERDEDDMVFLISFFAF